MYLSTLNKTEKEQFLSLAVAVIKADGIIEDSEKNLLNAYANEMQLSLNDVTICEDIDSVIANIAKDSTRPIQRAIFVELLALAFADGNYAVEEKELVKKIAVAFGLDSDFIDRAVNLQDAFTSVCLSLNNLVEKGE